MSEPFLTRTRFSLPKEKPASAAADIRTVIAYGIQDQLEFGKFAGHLLGQATKTIAKASGNKNLIAGQKWLASKLDIEPLARLSWKTFSGGQAYEQVLNPTGRNRTLHHLALAAQIAVPLIGAAGGLALTALARKVSAKEASSLGVIGAKEAIISDGSSLKNVAAQVSEPLLTGIPEKINPKHILVSQNDMPLKHLLINVPLETQPDYGMAHNTIAALLGVNRGLELTALTYKGTPLPNKLRGLIKADNLHEHGYYFPAQLYSRDWFYPGYGGKFFAPGSKDNELYKQFGNALKRDITMTPLLDEGGDMRVFTRRDGRQLVIFGPSTLEHVSRTLEDQGVKFSNSIDRYVTTTAKIMDGLHTNFNIDPENVMPFGFSSVTYRQALDADRLKDFVLPRTLDVLSKFDHPVPSNYYAVENYSKLGNFDHIFSYHTDLLVNTPDGHSFYLNSDTLDTFPQIRELIGHFGGESIALPAEIFQKGPYTFRTSYMNWINGRHNGRQYIFLPLQGGIRKLDIVDVKAMDILRSRHPDIQVVPIPLSNSIYSQGSSYGRPFGRDFGPHCLTNFICEEEFV